MTKLSAQPQQQPQCLLVKLGFLVQSTLATNQPERIQQSQSLLVKLGTWSELVRCRLTSAARRNATCHAAGDAAASRGPPLKGDTARTGTSPVRERSQTSIQTCTSPIAKSSTSPMTLPMQVLAPVIEYVSPIPGVSAATAAVNEYAAPALLVCLQER